VYIADAGLNSFLSWYEDLDSKSQSHIKSIHWCGDGDSLGDKGREFLSQTAARFEGRWRAHLYDTKKDFSDCAAITSLIEYDLRHEDEHAGFWIDVHGALGGRFDHEIGNVFEFASSLSRVAVPSAYVLGGETVLATCGLHGEMEVGDVFSVLPSNHQSTNVVQISNAEYAGETELRQPSHGLSNVALAKQVKIVPVRLNCPYLAIRTAKKSA
jgi:thiamine pyrophosphokinase